MKTEHGTNDSFSVKAKHKAYGDLAKLMDNVGHRSLPGGKITPGHVDEVVVSKKTMPAKHSVKKAAPLSMHEPEAGETKAHEMSEPPAFESKEHDMGEDGEETFHADRANPGDTAGNHSDDDEIMKDPAKVDAALAKFMVKGKKHVTKMK